VFAIETRVNRPEEELTSAAAESTQSPVLRIYDLREFLGPYEGRSVTRYGYAGTYPADVRQEAADTLIALIGDERVGPIWGSPGLSGNWLLVRAPPGVHHRIEQLLFLLRHPSRPAATAEGRR
jgi:hypothetical protein